MNVSKSKKPEQLPAIEDNKPHDMIENSMPREECRLDGPFCAVMNPFAVVRFRYHNCFQS